MFESKTTGVENRPATLGTNVAEDVPSRGTSSRSGVQAEAARLGSKTDPHSRRQADPVLAKTGHEPTSDEGDSTDPLYRYSVQPLPLTSNGSQRPGPPGEPGAYAVRSFRPPGPSTTTAGSDEDPASLEDGVMIHAHLVEGGDGASADDSDVLVVAEEVKSRRRWVAILVVAMALIFGSILVVGCILLVRVPTKEERDNRTTPALTQRKEDDNPHQDGCFQGVDELYSAIDAYVLFNATNSSFADSGQHNRESILDSLHSWGPMETWCVSRLKRLAHGFFDERLRDSSLGNATTADEISKGVAAFVHDLGQWDTSNAEDMTELFRGNQRMTAEWGIQHWDTSRVVRLTAAFRRTSWPAAEDSSLDLSKWDISSVMDLGELFRESDVQKAGVAGWDTQNVMSVYSLAERAPLFNEDIGGWNTVKFRGLSKTFAEASSFNQDLSRWNVGSMTNMSNAFRKATKFNSPLSSWDVSRVQGMMSIFAQAPAFNQDISGWNVSLVTDLRWAFNFASSFNQDLCSWGRLLPKNANTTRMFANTACPNRSDPVLSEGGPFCYNCNDNS